jgi:hypothetical protein
VTPSLQLEQSEDQVRSTIPSNQKDGIHSSLTFATFLPSPKTRPARTLKEKTKPKRSSSSPKISRVAAAISNKKAEAWRIQKAALNEKFKEGWSPPKKLSPDALDGIRHLHATAPDKFTTPVLAQHFEMSPEAIRRILKSKWQPTEDERAERRERWDKRRDRIWSQMTQLGLRPKQKRLERISDMRLVDGHSYGKS